MKTFSQAIILFFLFTYTSQFAGAEMVGDYDGAVPTTPNELLGNWLYYRLYYQDHFQEPLSPELRLTFSFYDNGEDNLQWYRTNQPGTCERRGKFTFDGKNLDDLVIWVSPKNHMSCGSDPDMQLGKHSVTRAEIKDGEFWLYLSLGAEDFVYVFKRIE
jgi:hypothetical protein